MNDTKSEIVTSMARARARLVATLHPLAAIVGGGIPAWQILDMVNGPEDVRVEVGSLMSKLAGIMGGEAEALAAVGDEAPHLLAMMAGMADGQPIQIAGQAMYEALWTDAIRDAMRAAKVGDRAAFPDVPVTLLGDAKAAAAAFLALISLPG